MKYDSPIPMTITALSQFMTQCDIYDQWIQTRRHELDESEELDALQIQAHLLQAKLAAARIRLSMQKRDTKRYSLVAIAEPTE